MFHVAGAALVFAGALTITHFLGEELDDLTLPHQAQITAFATGVTVTYVFLTLLPETQNGIQYLGNMAFFFVLLGFSTFHLTKKFIVTHSKSPMEIRHEFKELHTLFFFLYYIAIGILLQLITTNRTVDGLLFFIPIFLHTAVSSLSLTELHEDVLNRLSVKLAVSLAPLFGVGIASANIISIPLFYVILGTVTGMFLYTVIHDALPSDGEGAPHAYLLGTVLYAGLIVATWRLFG